MTHFASKTCMILKLEEVWHIQLDQKWVGLEMGRIRDGWDWRWIELEKAWIHQSFCLDLM